MEEPEQVILHYQMLEYLFRRCRLATSCNNYTWEGFLDEFPEYKDLLTESELKNIFWTEIAPNIKEYRCLTEEQADYFDPDGLILDVTDENLSFTLLNNEPIKDEDFACYKSENDVRRNGLIRPTDNDIHEMFKKPTVCDENEGIILNILADKPPIDDKCNRKFSSKCLEVGILTENDQEGNITSLSIEEITRRLRNPDILTCLTDFGIFEDCLRKAIKNRFENRQPEESNDNLTDMSNVRGSVSGQSLESSGSIMSIMRPNITRTPTRSMTRSLSQTTPSSRRLILDRSKSVTPTNRMTRSRRALVPDPALNLKMSKFMKKHESKN